MASVRRAFLLPEGSASRAGDGFTAVGPSGSGRGKSQRAAGGLSCCRGKFTQSGRQIFQLSGGRSYDKMKQTLTQSVLRHRPISFFEGGVL